MTTMYLHDHKVVKYSSWNDGSVNDLERIMRLDYYVYENEILCDSVKPGCDPAPGVNVITYGISVKKTEGDGVEEKYIENVTCDEAWSRDILRLLADNIVTPCCLDDMLEEIINSEYSVIIDCKTCKCKTVA